MKTLNSQVEDELIDNDASLVGFADLKDIPVEMTNGLPRAVSIAATLNRAIVRGISKGPTKEYFAEYERVNNLLAELCERVVKILTKVGNRAWAVEATTEQFDTIKLSTRIQHKTIATRAGLGWIGKSALLVTEDFGTAVRLATVFTDAEFEVGKPVNDSQCGECKKCVEACPASAITGRNWKLGTSRESIYNVINCCKTAGELSEMQGIHSTICGICINVCPWTQKYVQRET